MSDKPLVEAGKLFCFSEGQYSDFGYVGHFLALVPITKELFEQVKQRCMERIKAGEYKFGERAVDMESKWDVNVAVRNSFIPELVRTGAVLDIDVEEIYLGSTGELDF